MKPPFLTLFLGGVSFEAFLFFWRGLIFLNPLFFEPFVLGENPFFLNSLFKGFLFELPFLGRTLCFKLFVFLGVV
ncbi:hypothetical protein L934_05245 [Helicobacter pylori PZ5080]|uniref:Uncharacterized protein n=1 Tax=Helicobacter pylori PZ5080 TaxID=1337394 RepID=T2STW7_HELPX|nr:hypothetical protein L934_05245 [Helicobacter pylori PZ5080]